MSMNQEDAYTRLIAWLDERGVSYRLIDHAPEGPVLLEDPVEAETNPIRQYEAWPLMEGVVTLEEMKELMPFVCAGGDVYRAQVIGYYDEGGPTARIEVVFDATNQPAAVVFWRDISHLGRGYSLETLGVENTDW